MTNAALKAPTGSARFDGRAYRGTTAMCPDGADKASLTFGSWVGAVHRCEIPGPKLASFTADGTTVDAANPAVRRFVEAMLHNAVGLDGSPLLRFESGARNRRTSKSGRCVGAGGLHGGAVSLERRRLE